LYQTIIKMKKILFLIFVSQTLLITCCINEGSVGNDNTNSENNPPTIDPGVTVIIDPAPADHSCTPNPNGADLNMMLSPQEANFWCWAASSEMVMEKLGEAITQCEEANKRFGREDCCNLPFSENCDCGGWPRFARHGFIAERTDDAALSWEGVKQQVECWKAPFCVTWRWIEGGGHMMVISAYKTVDGENMVKLTDPLPVGIGAVRWISYSEYLQGPGYTHWDDFYNIRKRDSEN
jgi:hypothetical protein